MAFAFWALVGSVLVAAGIELLTGTLARHITERNQTE